MPESRSRRLVVAAVKRSSFVASSSSSSHDERDGGESSGSQAAFTAAAAVRLQVRGPDESPSSRAVDVASLESAPLTYIAAALHTATPGDDDIKRAASRDRTKQHPVVWNGSSSSTVEDSRTTASELDDERPCTSVRTGLVPHVSAV